jgi:plasmid stabilization system protein ParE
MAVKLVLAAESEQDIAEGYAWYENERTGLGEEFLSCVEACLDSICRTPKIHAIIHENYRRGLVRRFPYGIFYEYSEDTVTVYAIFHTARDPDKWRRRLP